MSIDLSYPSSFRIKSPSGGPRGSGLTVQEDRITALWGDHVHLRVKEHPVYHETLHQAGRSDLSWKIDSCMNSGRRLDCPSHPSHSKREIPIPCLRRTCPFCARKMQLEIIARLVPHLHRRVDELHGDRRVRMWTWTFQRQDRLGIRDQAERLLKSVRWFLRYTLGDRSRSPNNHCGLLVLEISPNGLVHVHGILESKFLSERYFRKVWKIALKTECLHGHRVQALLMEPDDIGRSVAEVTAYPLDPGKNWRCGVVDEALVARIEVALSGRRAVPEKGIDFISGLRRTFWIGGWHGLFPPRPSLSRCPDCGEPYTTSAWDDIFGGSYHRGYFAVDVPFGPAHREEFVSK